MAGGGSEAGVVVRCRSRPAFLPHIVEVCARSRVGRCAAHRPWLRQLPAAFGGAADNDAAGGCVGRGCAQAAAVDLRLFVAGSWGRAAALGPRHGPAAVGGADCVLSVAGGACTRRSFSRSRSPAPHLALAFPGLGGAPGSRGSFAPRGFPRTDFEPGSAPAASERGSGEGGRREQRGGSRLSRELRRRP